MKYLPRVICVVATLLFVESSCDAQIRTWHDIKSGEMRGKLVSVVDGTVNITGELRNVSIPFWNLDPNDQLWIRGYMRSRRMQHQIPKVCDYTRQWTNLNGGTFDGQLLQSDNREAVIVVDGKLARFEIKRLSESDAKYIRDWPGPIEGMRKPIIATASDQAEGDNAVSPDNQASSAAEINELSTDLAAENTDSVQTNPAAWAAAAFSFVLKWRRTSIAIVCLISAILMRVFRRKSKRQRVYSTPDDLVQPA
jgi:hypothetical protein